MEDRNWLKEELTKAYKAVRLGKTKKSEVMEFDKVAATEIAAITSEIHGRRYTTRPSTAFIVNKTRPAGNIRGGVSRPGCAPLFV